MGTNKLAAIPCKLFPGMFRSERVFEVRLANGEVYRGIAPRHFCWNALGRIVAEDEDTNGGDGKVAAKVLYVLDGDQVAVEVPDGEVLAVPAGQIVRRPSEIRPPVPASELQRDVPV
jgi:hypothetical protein